MPVLLRTPPAACWRENRCLIAWFKCTTVTTARLRQRQRKPATLRSFASENHSLNCTYVTAACLLECWKSHEVNKRIHGGSCGSSIAQARILSFRHRVHSDNSTSVSVPLSTARQLTQLATGGVSATESRYSALEVPLNTAVLAKQNRGADRCSTCKLCSTPKP